MGMIPILVPGARLELASRIWARDFKSLVYTNSTTRAQVSIVDYRERKFDMSLVSLLPAIKCSDRACRKVKLH